MGSIAAPLHGCKGRLVVQESGGLVPNLSGLNPSRRHQSVHALVECGAQVPVGEQAAHAEMVPDHGSLWIIYGVEPTSALDLLNDAKHPSHLLVTLILSGTGSVSERHRSPASATIHNPKSRPGSAWNAKVNTRDSPGTSKMHPPGVYLRPAQVRMRVVNPFEKRI